jgi:hypothetical protein
VQDSAFVARSLSVMTPVSNSSCVDQAVIPYRTQNFASPVTSSYISCDEIPQVRHIRSACSLSVEPSVAMTSSADENGGMAVL